VTRRLSLLLAAVGALVWLTGAPASAHASLLSSDPAEGSVVATVPDTVVLTFNEPVRVHEVKAYDATGADWPVEATASDHAVTVTPTADPGQGTVVIAWSVVSEDGHIVSGALTFAIGSGSAEAVPASSTTVTIARAVATGVAGLGLLISVGLALLGRRTTLADWSWLVGLGGALVAAPLHELAESGGGLSGLGDWLVWLNGVARWPSALLLAAYGAAALLRTVGRRAAYALLAPVVALLVATVMTWPAPAAGPASAAADHGDAGLVSVTATPGAERAVALEVTLTDPNGAPLTPYAVPTLSLTDGDVSLGDVALTETGPGTYRGEVTVPTPGEWEASVSVRTSEFDNPVAEVSLELG
jgi:methionine-rich copper-binding protein CopC